MIPSWLASKSIFGWFWPPQKRSKEDSKATFSASWSTSAAFWAHLGGLLGPRWAPDLSQTALGPLQDFMLVDLLSMFDFWIQFGIPCWTGWDRHFPSFSPVWPLRTLRNTKWPQVLQCLKKVPPKRNPELIKWAPGLPFFFNSNHQKRVDLMAKQKSEHSVLFFACCRRQFNAFA